MGVIYFVKQVFVILVLAYSVSHIQSFLFCSMNLLHCIYLSRKRNAIWSFQFGV